MTNRELLKFAAKAAGYVIEGDADKLVVQPGRFSGGFSIFNDNGGSSLWNPLADDGDALRLAVKLGIRIDWIAFDVVCVDFNSNYTAREYKKDDPYSATRRAIVRIAAEIGKSMN